MNARRAVAFAVDAALIAGAILAANAPLPQAWIERDYAKGIFAQLNMLAVPVTNAFSFAIGDERTAKLVVDMLTEVFFEGEAAIAAFEQPDGIWDVTAHFADAPDQARVRAFVADAAGEEIANGIAFDTVEARDWVKATLDDLVPVPAGRFVVHLHQARREHYDLRIECSGTLQSFAVPRGPSLKPLDKRLAVHTENHPLEYLDFEGEASRPEFWWFFLFIAVVNLALAVVSNKLSGAFSLAVLLPFLAVAVRRLHDTSRSGWWLLIWFLPLVGQVVLAFLLVQEGDRSPAMKGAAN